MIHAVGPDYVREYDGPDMDWPQERLFINLEPQPTRINPWLALLAGALFGGSAIFGLLWLYFAVFP